MQSFAIVLAVGILAVWAAVHAEARRQIDWVVQDELALYHGGSRRFGAVNVTTQQATWCRALPARQVLVTSTVCHDRMYVC
ncbi:hypothetical protein BCR44DRAFT_1423919, partial [Catenaria anguillulae PL171]